MCKKELFLIINFYPVDLDQIEINWVEWLLLKPGSLFEIRWLKETIFVELHKGLTGDL